VRIIFAEGKRREIEIKIQNISKQIKIERNAERSA
jgi:hypothetical protein